MVFSSITFLFYFLPLTLIVYHIFFFPVGQGWRPVLWRRLSNLFLFLVSCLFYFWGENFLVWIMLASTFIDYCCGLIISSRMPREVQAEPHPGQPRTHIQKLGLALSIVSNLAFLGYFKYFNFFTDTSQQVFSNLGMTGLLSENLARVVLPLGISFYTFQSMSYTIDVYRGRVKATRNFVDFACYVTMFPQLVAGPIVRYSDVAHQLVHRVLSRESFVEGITRFVIGMAKKVLVANVVAKPADLIFSIQTADLTTPVAWFGVLCYTLQIYFDFSGYSDMAIGLGKMLGFEFPENFNYPYIAQTIKDFWRRWHISLSTWFRDYLYISLGGSRHSSFRTFANLVVVFLLCGLWHGAAWNFVVWGLYHGAFLVFERAGLEKLLVRLPLLVRHVYTLLVVMVGWVVFRADTLSHAVSYLGTMAGIGAGDAVRYPVLRFATPEVLLMIAVGVILSAPLVPTVRQRIGDLRIGLIRTTAETTGVVLIVVLMTLVTLQLASGTHNPFIYFRF